MASTAGADTNIQDNAVVHVAKTNVGGVAMPTIIGDRVTIGHNAILHACVVKDDAFVGMGATLMDGATVEKGAMVAAGALVTPGVTIPSGELWAGAPARFMRAMTAEEKAFTATSAATYAEVGGVHAAECGCVCVFGARAVCVCVCVCVRRRGERTTTMCRATTTFEEEGER